MHSRIMGIMSKKDIDGFIKYGEELKLPLWRFEEDLPSFADYLGESENFEDDFDWFITCIKQQSDKIVIDKENHTIKILKGFKHDYFGKRFNKAKEFFNTKNALDIFCGITQEGETKYYTESELYNVTCLIEETRGFYCSDTEGYYQTLDSFIRLMDEDVEYVIFDSIDYHY